MAVELTEAGRKARAAYLREYRRRNKERIKDNATVHWNKAGEVAMERKIRTEGLNRSECGERLAIPDPRFPCFTENTESRFREFRHTLKHLSIDIPNSERADIWEAIICAYYLRSLASTSNKNKHPNIVEYTQMFLYAQAGSPSVPKSVWNQLFFRYAAREGMAGTYAMVPPQTEEEAAKLETHFQAAISTYKKWIKERDSYAEL